jgi:hypothetical protein
MSSSEHVVFFPASDGSPAFRRLPSLQEAVDFVEHLRNEQDVREVSVHSLAEVPLAFRTVYRVEVAGSVPAPAEPAEPPAEEPVAEAPAVEAPVAEATVTEPAPEAVDVPAQEAPVAEAPAEADDAVFAPDAEVVAASADGHSLGFFAG